MAGYTRQEVFNDGDVILAEHGNNEFNQVEAAFSANTGHRHDGTAGEGGLVSKIADATDTFGVDVTGTGAQTRGDHDVTGDITVGGTVDGRDVLADGTKLDGIEAGAKDDQIASEVPVTPTGTIAATDVQAALEELDTEKAALAGATFTGDVQVPNLLVVGNVDGRDVSVDGAKLDGIESGATADQIASEVPFTPGGGISAVNVQNALSELDTDKVAKAGDTMTGDLTVPNLITAGNVDGRDVSVDGAKLDGIEAGATQDQVASEVPFTPTGRIASTNVQSAVAEVSADIATQISAKVHHNAVVEVDFAASPYTVTDSNDGNMLQVDSSGGNVSIVLPDSAAVTEDIRISVVKYTADSNTVTVSASGTDTVNGSASISTDRQYEHVHLVLDQSDGQWLAAGGVVGTIAADSVIFDPSSSLYTATDVQGALDESLTLIGGADVTTSTGTQTLSAALDQRGPVFESISHMTGASPDAGIIVHTSGYTTAGDGGGARYLIQTAAEFGGTPDEFGDHTLANGNIAVIQEERPTSLQYGVIHDDLTDNTAALQALLDSNKKFVYVMPGVAQSGKLTISSTKIVWLDGTIKALASLATDMIRINTAAADTVINNAGAGLIDINATARGSSNVQAEKGVAIYIDAAPRVHINGIGIDGNRSGSESAPGNFSVIFGFDADRVRVNKVTISNSPLGGIYFNGGSDCEVNHSVLKEINGTAIGSTWRSFPSGGGTLDAATGPGTGHRFIGNLTENCAETNISCNSKHSVVANNICSGSTLSGIDIGHDSTNGNSNADFTTCTGNVSHGNTLDGISLSNASSCTFSGNTCYNNSRDGIRVQADTSNQGFTRGATFIGNTCRGNLRGINSTSNTGPNNIFVGNVCADNTTGFGLAHRADKTGSHDGANNASVLTDSGEAWDVDMFVGDTITNDTDGSSGVITANTATTITATLSGGTDNDWDTGDTYTISGEDKQTVVGNIVEDNTTGMNLNAVTRCTFHGNQVKNNSGNGWLESGGGNHVVGANDVSGNGTNKVYSGPPLPSFTTLPADAAALQYMWVDGTGDVRVHNAIPATGTDGVVVGTQT